MFVNITLTPHDLFPLVCRPTATFTRSSCLVCYAVYIVCVDIELTPRDHTTLYVDHADYTSLLFWKSSAS